jgi:HK97 family phage major capsid protein
MNTDHNMAGRAVCAVPAGLEIKERDGVFEIKTALDSYARAAENGFRQLTEVSEKTADQAKTTHDQLSIRMDQIEQKMARAATFGGEYISGFEHKTLGSGLVSSDQFGSFIKSGGRGHCRFVLEQKAISSLANSGGATAPPDRRDEIALRPQNRLKVRDLVSQAYTNSNLVQVPRELLFTNNAAIVAELATKPTSELTFELLEVPVRTIAHLMAASRQILDDAPQLRDTVDTKLRYGLGIVEELQLLLGVGTGDNINGLKTQATAYNTAANQGTDNPTDTIRRAIAQVETASQLPVDGIVVNSTDWSAMLGLKDADGGYLSGGPFGSTRQMLWGRPVVDTPSMPAGEFLVGSFRQAATIYDRMDVEVLLSSEHSDFFAKNMIAIRAEQRLALVVSKPWALVKGSYPA